MLTLVAGRELKRLPKGQADRRLHQDPTNCQPATNTRARQTPLTTLPTACSSLHLRAYGATGWPPPRPFVSPAPLPHCNNNTLQAPGLRRFRLMQLTHTVVILPYHKRKWSRLDTGRIRDEHARTPYVYVYIYIYTHTHTHTRSSISPMRPICIHIYHLEFACEHTSHVCNLQAMSIYIPQSLRISV
jgi:hypothetical protein